MKNPHLNFLVLIAFLFFNNVYGAPDRTCRIIFLDRPANAPKSLHLFDGTTSQEVELPSMNLSPSYKLASGAIHLKLLNSKVDDPKSVSPDAPSVEIPANYSDFYLIITSHTDNEITPVKLQAIQLDGENFKVGQTLWMNYSDKTIAGKLGEQILSLKPDDSQIVATPFSDKSAQASGYYSASFTYQLEDETTFAPITEQQWWYDAKSRHLGFILNSGGKLPKIFFFRDFRE